MIANAQGRSADASHMSFAVRTETGDTIPAGALGTILIQSPREAALLHLRGMAGHGKAILRASNGSGCLVLPLRFVAGDFGGTSISTRSAEPIHMVVRSTRVANALKDGQDIVSDSYRISHLPDDPKADLIVQSGLGNDFGFVLNPGRSVLADIFGARPQKVPCSKE